MLKHEDAEVRENDRLLRSERTCAAVVPSAERSFAMGTER